MKERKLIDYLPPAVRRYAEYQGITAAQQPEFSRAWAGAAALRANQFFDTLDETGLRRWERMMQITPRGTDSLETRRARVEARFSLQRPYTLPWLLLWLAETFGPENFSFDLTDYTAALALDYDAIPDADRRAGDVRASLAAILPENLLLELEARRQTEGVLSVGALAQQSLTLEVWPRVVTRRETTGTALSAAILETHQTLDIPPNDS